jgi:hypothetical protein
LDVILLECHTAVNALDSCFATGSRSSPQPPNPSGNTTQDGAIFWGKMGDVSENSSKKRSKMLRDAWQGNTKEVK